MPIIYEGRALNGQCFRMLGAYNKAICRFFLDFARCDFSVELSYTIGKYPYSGWDYSTAGAICPVLVAKSNSSKVSRRNSFWPRKVNYLR